MAPFLDPLNKNRLAGLRFRTRAEGPFLESRIGPSFAQNVPQICFARTCWLASEVGHCWFAVARALGNAILRTPFQNPHPIPSPNHHQPAHPPKTKQATPSWEGKEHWGGNLRHACHEMWSKNGSCKVSTVSTLDSMKPSPRSAPTLRASSVGHGRNRLPEQPIRASER